MSKFLELYESVMDEVNLARIRPQTIVVIDPEALEQEVIANDIIKRKGLTYLSQLKKMATEKYPLYVSALKAVRPASNVYAALPTSNDFQEADVVDWSPGLQKSWNAPMTLPLSILKPIVSPENIMQIPVPGREASYERSEGDNSLNNGGQHPNTVGQKELRASKGKK